MKKLLLLAISIICAATLLLAGCGKDSGAKKTGDAAKTLTVGASAVPHAEILRAAAPLLAKKGVTLKVVEFTDYVQPNTALENKELDANYFQHVPYLNKFNEQHGTHIVPVASHHIEPMGVYSHKIKDLKNLPDGAKVAIPNDPSNGARALLLLQTAGVIKLKDGGSVTSGVPDITANPHHVKIIELDAAQLPRSLDDVTIAAINTNYALQANLNPLKDALAIEPKDSPYANVICVRKGDENNPLIKELITAMNSPQVKKFMEDKYKGTVIPTF